MRAIDLMRAWLPYPEYRFFGGPFDGQRRIVDLVELSDGMHAPPIWRICELPEVPPLPFDGTAPMEQSRDVHTYRFIPHGRSINEGHYEYAGER